MFSDNHITIPVTEPFRYPRVKGHSLTGGPFPNTRPLTFHAWLLKNTYRVDDIGSLARDVRRNGGWPAGQSCEAEYLVAQGAGDGMLEAPGPGA
jgi:hypothetical protein